MRDAETRPAGAGEEEAARVESPKGAGSLERGRDHSVQGRVSGLFCRVMEAAASPEEAQGAGAFTQRLLEAVHEELGLDVSAVYVETPGQELSLAGQRVGEARLPESAPAGSERFVRWLRAADGPALVDRFFVSAGDITAGEALLPTALGRAGLSYALRAEASGTALVLCWGRGSEKALTKKEIGSLETCAAFAAGFIGNISARKEAETAAREAEGREARQREFVAESAKRAVTSLSVLKSSVWSLDGDGAAGGILVDMARDAVRDMESSVKRLLALAQLDAGCSESRLERAELSSMVEECLRGYIPRLEEEGITVRLRDGAGAREVLVDTEKIEVALREIAGLAVAAAGRGGQVTVETYVSSCGPDEGRGGSGAADGPLDVRLESVVDLPYAVVSIEYERKSGNGPKGEPAFGIDLCRGIAEAHGGRLIVEEGNGGTGSISLWLPAGCI